VSKFALTSEAFADGAPISGQHTCEGEDVSPPLAWANPPDRARDLWRDLDEFLSPPGKTFHDGSTTGRPGGRFGEALPG
jgi:hypothetical protein